MRNTFKKNKSNVIKFNNKFLSSYNKINTEYLKSRQDELYYRNCNIAFEDYINSLHSKLNFNDYNEDFIPKSKYELNDLIKNCNNSFTGDYPCFTDAKYVYRKNKIKNIALNYNFNKDNEIPYFNYTDEENFTWNLIYNKLEKKLSENCSEIFHHNFQILQRETNVDKHKIPQLRDISNVLEKKNGIYYSSLCRNIKIQIFLEFTCL